VAFVRGLFTAVFAMLIVLVVGFFLTMVPGNRGAPPPSMQQRKDDEAACLKRAPTPLTPFDELMCKR